MSSHAFEGRIGFGQDDGNGPPANDPDRVFFFGPDFVQGSTSYSTVVSFDDGTVQADLSMTIEGFDSMGNPAPLRANRRATYVELGVGDNYLNSGESVKVTYDMIDFTTIGALPMGDIVDPASLESLLSSIALSAFHTDSGDTFSYTGPGAPVASGTGTRFLTFEPPTNLVSGDMFEIEATGGTFRLLFTSQDFKYDIIPDPDQNDIPEPSTIALVGIGLVAVGLMRRR